MNTLTFPADSTVAIGRFGRQLLATTMLAWFSTFAMAQQAQPPATPPVVEPEKPEAPAATPADPDFDIETDDRDSDDFDKHGTDHSVILRFEDSTVGPDEVVDAVVSIGGSSTSSGRVREAVVSIFGNTRVTGPVGESAVAIFGSTYVNSRIGGDVVAVFGDVELGPEARVGGEVVVVSGLLTRDPAATVDGGVQQVTLPANFGRFEWLRPWIKHCLLLGRPLAFEPGLGWAWGLAIGFLTLYVLLAVMFSSSVEKCVTTIETRPGATLVASLLTLILTPVLTVVLMVTVVGFALVPFFWIALFIAGLFGKSVILAVIGRRLTRFASTASPLADYTIAVAVGGAIMLLLYVIPIVGFIAYKVFGILALGVVVYTILLAAQAKRELAVRTAPAPAAGSMGAVGSVEPVVGPAPTATDAPAAAAATVESVPDSTLPRAGFWIRMGALVIDMILVGILCGVLGVDRASDDLFLPLLATYGAVMWKLKGTTVGGILCNLRLVRVDGREVDWATAIARALGCFLSLVVAGLGFIWIAIDPDRQGWHDKIAGTAVVRVPKGRSLV
ncbi:RDD family protein [Povalibacter sp.]|uniref:RDD family protein n=1 Tax=Povalibacter sp. TaxID=1962978 RepID=UPI002F3FD2E5